MSIKIEPKSQAPGRAGLVLGPMRPPFLILAVACVFLGFGSAVWTAGRANPLYALLALAGGLAAHISVNAFNECFDYRSGLDFRTTRTPFSGGSGTLPANPAAARTAWLTSWLTLALTAGIGIFFLIQSGMALLPLGLLGLAIIFAYTPCLTRSPLLCLLAPGLGFGLLMVMGVEFVLTSTYSWAAFFASLVPFFLVSNLLLLNQFPDVDADRSIGRRHYPIVIGRKRSALLYGAFLLLAYLSIAAGVLLKWMPAWTLLGLLTLALAAPTALKVYRNADNLPALAPSMAMNVLISVLTPLLVGIGFLIG